MTAPSGKPQCVACRAAGSPKAAWPSSHLPDVPTWRSWPAGHGGQGLRVPGPQQDPALACVSNGNPTPPSQRLGRRWPRSRLCHGGPLDPAPSTEASVLQHGTQAPLITCHQHKVTRAQARTHGVASAPTQLPSSPGPGPARPAPLAPGMRLGTLDLVPWRDATWGLPSRGPET